MPATSSVVTEPAPAALGRGASWMLTTLLCVSAAVFVIVTVGTSLVGRTSFYAGGLLVNNLPWIAAEYEPVDVTNNFLGDTVDTVIPSRAQIVDRALDGEWPGWSSLQGAGAELGSIPSYGMLAPTALAWWLLPHSLAPGWEKLTVLVVAAAGTALFLRRLGTGGHAAWLGGMIYAGSGFMIAWTNWPQAGVAAMLPWLFWSTERALQLRTWPAHVPVALSVAFLLLGGFPAVAGLGFYAAGLYVVVRVLARDSGRRPWRQLASSVVRLATALVTGALLAGAQLAVFVYTFLDLDRTYREDAFTLRLPLRMALTALFPNVWGTKGGGGFFTDTNPIESNAYLGAAAVVLAAVALLLPRRSALLGRARWYFASVVVVGAALIYVQGPLLTWVGALPVFAGNPIGRLTSVVLLAGAVLAGIGFDAALHGVRTSAITTARLLVGLVTVVLATVALARFASRETGEHFDVESAAVIALTVGGVCATCVGVAAARLRPRWRVAALSVVPVVVVIQGVSAAVPMWPQVEREDFYPTTAVHRFLQSELGHDRIAVVGATMVNGSTAYYGLRSATGHVFASPTFADLQRLVSREGRLSDTYWALPGDADPSLWQTPGLDRMGVRYLTVGPEMVVPGAAERLTYGDREMPVPGTDEEAMTVSLPGGPLRGVLLDFRSGPAEQSAGFLVAELVDSRGKVLTSTRRFTEFPRGAVPFYVPMAGESLPDAGRHTVRMHWEGPGAAPRLAVDPGGRPALSVIRPEQDGLRLAYADEAVVWERLSALPRIRWAGRTQVVPDPVTRARAVARRDLPADVVVLDEAGHPSDGRPAQVRVLEDSGDVVTVRVDAEGAGHLVVADSVQTDWTASVDGVETGIVAADHAFGAVPVPEGSHDVTLRYTPRGAALGAAASGAGVTALLLMGIPSAWDAVRRRRDRTAERPIATGSGGPDPRRVSSATVGAASIDRPTARRE